MCEPIDTTTLTVEVDGNAVVDRAGNVMVDPRQLSSTSGMPSFLKIAMGYHVTF